MQEKASKIVGDSGFRSWQGSQNCYNDGIVRERNARTPVSVGINVAVMKKSSINRKNYSKKQEARRNTTLTSKPQAWKTLKNNISINVKIKCYKCEKGYLASKCTLNKNVMCNACGKVIYNECFQGKQSTNQIEKILNLNTARNNVRAEIRTILQVNDWLIEFEIDVISVISIKNARISRFDHLQNGFNMFVLQSRN